MNNNHNHISPDCAFGETLVAFLYDEADETERSNFAAHLPACQSCLTEIAGFGEVSRNLQNWRETEFATLSTPLIELPEMNFVKKSAPQRLFAPESKNWLTKITEFFAFSPPVLTGATALAALAIGVALFFVFGHSAKTDVATTQPEKVIQQKTTGIAENSNAPMPSPNAVRKTETPEVSAAKNMKPNKPTATIPATRTVAATAVRSVKIVPVQVVNNLRMAKFNNNVARVIPHQKNSAKDLKAVEAGFRELLNKNEADDSLSLQDIIGEVGER